MEPIGCGIMRIVRRVDRGRSEAQTGESDRGRPDDGRLVEASGGARRRRDEHVLRPLPRAHEAEHGEAFLTGNAPRTINDVWK